MFCSRCGTEVQTQAKFCPSCGLDLSTTTPLQAVEPPEKSEATELDSVREALQDEWEVLKELGRGGMAIVYSARDKQLDREVAIKVLPFSLAYDKEFVERFQREARTAAKLEHPHIIPIYRVGKSGRIIYFVMKFLRGSSLSDRLEQRATLPPAEIRQLLIEGAKALGYAHKNAIVHRDIKPDNMMFDEAGHVVIMDFGIAKAASQTRLTGTGMSIGTPHYMSPEQARAQKLDGRSDIYSLGVVAYQCLTGQVPFDGEDAFSIGYKHIMEDLPAPEFRLAEQRQLFEVVKRMMAKAPEERFQNADELVAVLEGRAPAMTASTVAVPSSGAATTIMPTPPGGRPSMPPGARPSTPTTPIPKAEPKPEPKKKKRGGVLVGLFLVLVLGGGGAGGYCYFGMGAACPVPFLANLVSDTTATEQPPDTTTVVTIDNTPADTAAPDTTAAATEDTTAGEPLPEHGVIVLGGVPSLAIATLDGERVTPGRLTVAPGAHRIVVRQTGYRSFERTVQVARGSEETVSVRLERIPPVVQPTAQCDDPTADHFNLESACYDTPARPTASTVLDAPQGATTRPSPVILWVRVRADGTPETAGFRWETQSDNASHTRAAALFATRELTYAPAQRGGQPVVGWARVTVAARPPR